MSTAIIYGKDENTGSTDPVNLTDSKLHIAQYVWDTNTLSWIRQTGGGTAPGTDVTVTNFPTVQTVQDVARTTLVDASNPVEVYVGEAAIGSSTASSAWRIQQITIAGPVVDIKFSGSAFNSVWDNRTSLTYS